MDTGQSPSDLRCVAIIDEALPPGLAANAVGVMALTLGATLPELVGPELVDADGTRHPGLISRGLPVLAARSDEIGGLRARALEAQVSVIGLPSAAQQTTDYGAFRDHVARLSASEITYLGLVVHGPRKAVNKVTGGLALLR